MDFAKSICSNLLDGQWIVCYRAGLGSTVHVTIRADLQMSADESQRDEESYALNGAPMVVHDEPG
jgi:hypothetical protein